MSRLFGTDGVRGVANTELSPLLAFNLGYCGAKVLAEPAGPRPRILVGHDSRISAGMLQAALVAGITSSGADVYLADVIPTPGVAYLTRTQGFDAGVMISASHNSFEFNGIKFFNKQGFKLADIVEDEIERMIKADSRDPRQEKIGEDLGRVFDYSKGQNIYLQYLKDSLGLDLKGTKIAIDCANGAASYLAPSLFRELGAEIVVIANQPNGLNINDGCGSTHLDKLCQITREEKCDIGFAFDGDADRMLAVDAQGRPVDGDKIMVIIASQLKASQRLPQDTLVVTVMSNLGLHRAAEKLDLKIACTKVGDRYVLEEMQTKGYGFGGEQSGHMILLELATTGDGLLSALALLQALEFHGEDLEEMESIMHVYPQVLVPAFIPNENKTKAMADPEIMALIEEVDRSMGDEGRVLVRPSGTEPQIRVMIEGDDHDVIDAEAKRIAAYIVEKYGDK
ncbi:MAG: phosphoglucosamine mutase [Fastidiosipilaceae bacterium]|jgi:phosphoglucosamine mutase|nr:phosphoglucosamine mutase [Clostridiaceae bacterium]